MQRQKHGAEHFARVDKVAEISLRVVFAAVAIALGIERGEVLFVSAVAHNHSAVRGDCRAVSRDARGKNAVEHIHAADRAFDETIGRAYAHQIARNVAGHFVLQKIEDVVHDFFRFAYRKSADGDAVRYERFAAFQAFAAQIFKHVALYDGKERLLLSAACFVRFVAAFQPVARAEHRRFRLIVREAVFAALIERHNDVRAEVFFYLHCLFGREKVFAAVHVRGKFYARVGDFVEFGKRKHLKAAAVRENRAIPVHEFMQAARLFDKLVAGAHVQVVGVG